MIYLFLPILAWQGRRIRATVPRLPEAAGPTEGTARGDGTPLRIAVIGDSTAAGVGAQRNEAALPGYLAAEVARRTGRPVRWRVLARSGATAASVRHRLVPRLRDGEPPQAVSVAVGVNDLLKLRPLRTFERDVAALVAAIRECAGATVPVALSAMPPLGLFPSLPQPTRAIFGRRARAMDRRLRRVADRTAGVRHVPFTAPSHGRFFAADGFHPSSSGYADWAAELGPTVAEMVSRG